VTPWNLADKYKSSWEICPTVLYNANAGRISLQNICAYVPKTQHLISLCFSPPNETEFSKDFNILFKSFLCNLKPWCW
jgi:hypothetical protein